MTEQSAGRVGIVGDLPWSPAAAPRAVFAEMPVPAHRGARGWLRGLTLAALAVGGGVALAVLGVVPGGMNTGWESARHFAQRMGGLRFPPLGELVSQTALTLGITVTGTVLAALIALPVAYLAAGVTSPGRVWRAAGRAITVLARAVPDVVLAMVFALVFSLGALPGILAIALHSVGMVGKMFADALEQTDAGPPRALRAAGASRSQVFWGALAPQAAPSWAATVLHRFDINVRGSVLLGAVGVAGLGKEMRDAFTRLDYGLGMGIALVILLLCLAVEALSMSLRTALTGDAGAAGAHRRKRATQRERRRRERAQDSPPGCAGARALPRRPWTPTRVRGVVAAWGAMGLLVGAVWICHIQWSDLWTVWPQLPGLLTSFWPLSCGVYGCGTLVGAMSETVAIALGAATLSVAAGMVLAPLAARGITPWAAARPAARAVLLVIRAIPELILAIVLIIITGLGAQAATLALAVAGVGLVGKLMADSLEELPRGPATALVATGSTWPQVHAAATIPRAGPALIAHGLYALDTNVRAATVLGIVGGGGVGYYLLGAAQGSHYGQVAFIVMMITVVVIAIEALAVWLRDGAPTARRA